MIDDRRGRGGGGGAALPEVSVEVGDIRLSRDIQRENMARQQAQLEAGFAQELAASQAAITREAADIQRQVDMEVIDQRNALHQQAFELRMATTADMNDAELQIADTRFHPSRDKLDEVFDYQTIRTAMIEVVRDGHINLLETLADRVVERLLAMAEVRAVRVRVHKYTAFDDVEEVGVEIHRRKPE